MKPFVSFSKERHRLYNRNYHYYTLSEFIYKLHEKNFTKQEIDSHYTTAIIAHLLPNLDLNHFSYLLPQSDTVKDMASFFIACKRNERSLDDFAFGKKKKEDLQKIFDSYNDFLQKHNLADLGDIEKEVLEFVKKNNVEVIADSFISGKIHFFTSKLQKDIFDKLNKEQLSFDPPKNKPNSYLIASFNAHDEVKNALKIIRELIGSGESIDDIKIIATDIDEYYPLLQSYFDEFGVTGYSTKGEDLYGLLCAGYPMAKAKFQELKERAKLIQAHLRRFGVHTSGILKDLVQNMRIFIPNDGIEITETNQIYIYPSIKHLIFIGADITHFPPKRDKNIFYTKDYEKLFYANLLFEASMDIYQQMKAKAENLYIIYSRYQGKTARSLSLIVDQDLPSYLPKTKSDIDLLKENKRAKNDNIEKFYQNLQKSNLDRYDGIGIQGITLKHLSASRINEYNACPRSYFYKNILHIKSPAPQKVEMDYLLNGEIMHKAFEIALEKIKKGATLLQIKASKESIAQEAYNEILEKNESHEDIFTKLFYDELLRILDNFFVYLEDQWEIKNGFTNSQMEKLFYLDEKLQITEDENDYFIKGFIDRIDINDEVEIYDYKSKRIDKLDKGKIEEIQELKDVQLGLYTYWAKQKYPDMKVTSKLITFRTDNTYQEFAVLEECEEHKSHACYNEEYEKKLKELIFWVRDNISQGNFVYDDSDEEYCGWCEYERICKRYIY